MVKKRIPKAHLDKVINGYREYWRGGAHPYILDDVISECMRIYAITGIYWYSLQNAIDGIVATHGLKPDATNEDIYAILRLLGWEVSD